MIQIWIFESSGEIIQIWIFESSGEMIQIWIFESSGVIVRIRILTIENVKFDATGFIVRGCNCPLFDM